MGSGSCNRVVPLGTPDAQGHLGGISYTAYAAHATAVREGVLRSIKGEKLPVS